MEKTRILESLNEQAVLLPTLVNRALTANDRIKYRFALLARYPDEPAFN